jgi:hypothetical protein
MKMAGPLGCDAELMERRVMSCSDADVSSDWRHLRRFVGFPVTGLRSPQ